MAGFVKCDFTEQVYTPSLSKESIMNQEVFMPKYTLDQPCDVVLVSGDGKEFKAHRKVLSEASPFFEKLLNSNMKESKEGVIRLELFSGTVMAATLNFIYTGHFPQILAEDEARELVLMADYLNIQKLKSLAEEILAQRTMLNASNFMSIYNFSERLQCEELFSKTKEFILTNFIALYTGTGSREGVKDILKNMSSKEVEMWISSDKISVSVEEDVFNIILAWINHDKSKRKKYFAELFRHVRLVYVSRDVLISDVVTNELVKDNEGCLDLVKDAIHSIDAKKCENLSVPPRKSLETPAIVMCMDADFVCYFPDEETWCRLGKIPFNYGLDKISSFVTYT
ncbi:kelch-like protein 2 [Oculina patagonica]